MEKHKKQYNIYVKNNNLKVVFYKVKGYSDNTHNNKVDNLLIINKLLMKCLENVYFR
jgi:hypothetical protein